MLEHFDTVASMLADFKAAGSAILRCPTAGANRYRLRQFGFESETSQINRELMRRSRKALESTTVFGTGSSIGLSVEPFGDLAFDDAVSCFSEQGRALADGGAEGFFIDGMSDIQEARAALIALRDISDLPVMVCMSIGAQGCTLGGTDPLSALVTLQSLGADAVGFGTTDDNVSLVQIVRSVKRFARVPLFALPCVSGKSPEQFGVSGSVIVSAGANLIGCSGTATVSHVASLGAGIKGVSAQPAAISSLSALSSPGRTVLPGKNSPFAVVGERINPTGKKQLQATLREGSLEMVRQFAFEQEQRGATILDVNMGLSGIDEKAMMLRAISLLSAITPVPLCIDTTRPEVMEAALRLYPGRALVNSVSGEKERIECTLPSAARYGAMFIALPLTDAGIPRTVKERIEVIDMIMQAADPFGVSVDDIVVDALVMTVSSDPNAAGDSLDLISWCSDTLGSNTICGLSNVSFGMPERQWINTAFIGMAMGRGLTMAIANPSSDGIMATVQAYNALRGHDTEMLARRGRFMGVKS